MVKERRVFNNYPESLRTRQNNRETFIADDPLFEPEQANFLNGFIGDVSVLSDEDLARTPRILEMDAERQKYQLSVGATFIDPDSQIRISAAFYTDMIRQIEANGGDTTDPNRVFATDFYAWTPPIDYDKHINFGRYRWVGPGSADVQGEYITIEPSHSKTVLYEWDGASMIMREVKVVDGLPAVEPDGTFVEDASTNERFIYRSNGVAWVLLDLDMVDDVPAGSPALDIPTYFYVARTGPDFNRPLVWRYSDSAGRWIPTPVIVNREPPETIRDGMVWEDIRIGSERTLKVALNGAFSDLTYTRAPGPPGTPGTDGEYLYDTRNFSDLPAGCWEANNWWRHHEDLSPVDATRAGEDQATRPIIEFWNGLEQIAGDVRDARNDLPVFKKFAFDLTPDEVVDTGEGTTIFQYQVGTGQDDFVLGFPLIFNDTGEFLFDLTLETDTSAFTGYKYFKDTNTGFLHGIWFKSDVLTNQAVDSDGQYDIPVGISSNPDHEILTNPSRSRMLRHMTEIMKAQPTFAGSEFGLNSYRWTRRNPTLGATIIDAEQTHLRTLATLQSSALDTPNAIRSMAKEYNKVLFRFKNRMNQLWDNLQINTGSGTLTVTATDAVDAILTSLFIGRTTEFPFNQSDMGTYLETLVTGGIATIVDTTPKPIFIAPSPTRVGAAPCFKPASFEERDGTTVLRGHEGTIIPSFGDERDLIWLELQERFFAAVPTRKCEETDTFSARFSGSNFFLQDFYGNFTPQTQTESVDEVVTDFNAVVGPADGLRVFSAAQGVFAVFSAGQWLTRDSLTDEIFLNNDDGEFYIFNGKSVNLIDRFERPVTFDYSWNEFREIIRRDFERFIIFREQDFSENTTFVAADPFTWNYRSAGVEGHYLGIYRRVYNTVRPQSHPWEVMGYAIEPTWWRTSYVPDSTAADGTPRYGSAHPMWADFATGTVAHPSGAITNPAFILTAPIPVDAVGELLDPIAAGVVDEEKLDKERIDDIWVYGDGAPEEQEFLNSNFFPFSISLAGYLMKNGIWMDTLWSEIYISIGTEGTNKLFRAPHVVHETTLTRPAISTLPVHLERDANGDPIQRIGIVAWISEFVNVNGGDPTNDFGRVVRNTSAALTWKASGFINQNRTIISTLSRNEIPFTDVHVLLHNSQPLTSTFCSGVLITRESPNGFRVFGFDPFDPFFTIERPAVPIVGGQVVLTEEFTVEFTDDTEPNVTGGTVFPNQTLQRTFIVTEFGLPRSGTALDTAQLSVIINGLRIKPQFIKVDPNANTITVDEVVQLEEGDEVSVQVVTTQSNPSTQVRQFVVNDVAFPYFVEGSGEFDRIEYGRFFETSTEVIQFMIGYGRFLTQQGWVFDGLSEGGSTRDWLLGAQRFARWVLEVETPWNPNPQLDPIDEDVFLYSPVQDAAKFQSEFGQGTNIESIMNGAFGILNQRSEPIEVDETVVSRIDDTVTIERVDGTNTESAIFGARVNLIEAEHVVVLSNVTRFNDIIYDPVSGLSQRTLIVDSYRTLNWEGRAEANGYVINGGELLPNFEKQAFDFTRFYDRFNTIDDPLRRDQARNLYGFVPANQSRFGDPTKSVRRRQTSDSSQYMIPAGAADRSRFDYARGMMQAQGTRRPVFAFTRGTTIGRDNFFLSEDWAWKLGPTYGDTRRQTIQISVDTADFRDDIQVVQFGGPIVVTNNTIEIPDFNRNDLTADGDRWILPPAQCKFQNTCNLEFPINRDTGLIDVATHRHYAKLFDLETGNTVIDHVHYDPEIDRFDTVARCQIEFENPLDPARYNVVGNEEITTPVDCWGAEQVGCLWWNPDRKKFIDYRRLIPEYEDMAAVWGKPLFYKSTIERPGTLVSDQDETGYTGVPKSGTFSGGTGYVAADTITLSDGTVVTVDAVVSGVVTEFTVTSPGTTLVRIGVTLTQTSTSGAGTGFDLTPDQNNIENETDLTVAILYQYDDLNRTGTPVDLAAEQGLSNGDEVLITIRKANQSGYNLVNFTATVTSATTGEIEFEVSASPDTPATGDPEVVFGHIDIYEWVESPVVPEEWEEFVAGLNDPTHPSGTPLNIDDPSFVQLTRQLSDGRTEVVYYFWVLNSVGINRKNARPIEGDIGKELTAFEISQRLSNPTARGLAWFAPVDINHMLIHTDGEQVLDDYGFEILIDQRFRQTHHEFILVSEGNRFLEIPDQIVEKMIDSLSGQDAKLNTVPSPLLEETERFGACFFPIQTVFANREQAVGVYTVAINRILARRNLTGLQGLTSIFRLSEEFDDVTNPTGFWQRSAFMNEAVEGLPILETVTTVAEMNRRLGEGLYAEGDLVRVLTSDFVDAWDGSPVSATYQLLDTGGFLAVSIDNQTASINTNIYDDPVRFREMYFLIYNSIFQERIEQNELIFSLFHEIKIQHPDPRCDWLFKTSYITTQVFTSIDNSPFVRPDEVTAIRDNLLSTKPYRTKLRGEINTVGGIEEDVNVNLQEFPDKKIALILDRLSCNALDDCGWDTFAWDTRDLPCDRWDTALWDFEDLGREEFYLVESIPANDTDTVYEATPIFDPTLYEVKVEVKLNGVVQQSLSNSTVITKLHNKIIIDTVFGLSTQFTIDVLQAQGFYQGDDPNFIGTTLEDTLFQPVQSDYKHAIARRPDTPLIGCDDPNDPLGGRPEERIVTEVCDSVNICVINDYSDSLQGWDATPWDVNPWDQGPSDIGRRVFIVSVGKQLETPPGPEVLPTSEDITVVDPFAIIGTNPFTFKIVQIEQQVGGAGPFNIITEGVEFEFLGIFNNAIKAKVPDNQEFVTDGIAQQFQTTAGTQVAKVFLDGLLQSEGPDYTLDGTRTLVIFNFVPAPARKIEVEFEPYIQPTDVIRYRFNCWPVGMLGTFMVSPLSGALTGLTYDVIRGEFKFDTSPPPPNEFFTICYTVPRKNGLPESILVRMPEIVADILDDHESYDDPNGFNEFRPVGTRIINTTSNMVFEWDGATWNFEPPIVPGTQFFVTRKQQIWEFDGLAFNLLFSVGDPFTKPPVLDYPLFGRGITFGTYAFGQAPNANVEYPDAFQVIQHPGDCPP